MVDFSGAVAEAIDLQAGDYCTNPAAQNKLFSDLLKVHERGGIISCSIRVSICWSRANKMLHSITFLHSLCAYNLESMFLRPVLLYTLVSDI